MSSSSSQRIYKVPGMKPAARLAAFAALLALVFAAAALAGGIIDHEPAGDGAPAHGTEHSAGAEKPSTSAASPPPGLAVAQGDYALELERRELPARTRSDLGFRIATADGSALKSFAVEHERRMHLIVVRRDGRGFQHLHPSMDAAGRWSTGVVLQPGVYRVFADFNPGAGKLTLGADLTVDGDARYRPLPAPATTTGAGAGLRVRLETGATRAGEPAELRFTVSRDGRTVPTEPYLGAGGHLVALREGDLAYLHTHPSGHGDAVTFESEFPTAGRYRLYFQFELDGRVHTAELTREVGR